MMWRCHVPGPHSLSCPRIPRSPAWATPPSACSAVSLLLGGWRGSFWGALPAWRCPHPDEGDKDDVSRPTSGASTNVRMALGGGGFKAMRKVILERVSLETGCHGDFPQPEPPTGAAGKGFLCFLVASAADSPAARASAARKTPHGQENHPMANKTTPWPIKPPHGQFQPDVLESGNKSQPRGSERPGVMVNALG